MWAQLFNLDNLKQVAVGNFPGGAVGGIALTLFLGVASILLSFLLGTVLGLLRSSRFRPIAFLTGLYVEPIRGIPLVMLFFWIWFVPPYFGVNLSGVISALIALTLFSSAYVAEIVRGGLRSVERGQAEAGRSIGLTNFQVLRFIVLPQAIRAMLPALTSRFMVTMKDTSLAFLIGLKDLTGVSKLISARVMAPIEVYVFVLVAYYVINRGVSSIGSYLERRMSPDRVLTPEPSVSNPVPSSTRSATGPP